jgi:anti-sigma factor RsiW
MEHDSMRDSDPNPDCRYVTWVGAYLLGALDPADRSEFAVHVRTCPRCRDEIVIARRGAKHPRPRLPCHLSLEVRSARRPHSQRLAERIPPQATVVGRRLSYRHSQPRHDRSAVASHLTRA